MTLARQINKKLDEILLYKAEIKMVKKDYNDPNFELKDINTGELVTKKMVLNKAKDKYNKILEELNSLTNNGKNCINIFNNSYYVNDMTQDALHKAELT